MILRSVLQGLAVDGTTHTHLVRRVQIKTRLRRIDVNIDKAPETALKARLVKAVAGQCVFVQRMEDALNKLISVLRIYSMDTNNEQARVFLGPCI